MNLREYPSEAAFWYSARWTVICQAGAVAGYRSSYSACAWCQGDACSQGSDYCFQDKCGFLSDVIPVWHRQVFISLA